MNMNGMMDHEFDIGWIRMLKDGYEFWYRLDVKDGYTF